MPRLLNPRLHCMCWFDHGDVGCMHVDAEESFLSSPLVQWSLLVQWNLRQDAHAFEMTHFWVDVFRADEFLARLVSRLEFKVGEIRRKQMIRIVCPLIAVWLTLLL